MNPENKIANWIVPAGQVARKLSPASVEGFLGAGGVQIEEGTRAVLIVNGVVQHEVGPGIYQFEKFEPQKFSLLQGKPNAIATCLAWMCGIFRKSGMQTGSDGKILFAKSVQYGKAGEPVPAALDVGFFPKDVTTFAVVICRTAPFEICLGLDSLRGGNQNYAKVSAQITSISSFLRWAMVESPNDYISENCVATKMQKKLGDRAHQILDGAIRGDSTNAESALQQEWGRLGSETGLQIVHLLGLASEAQVDARESVAKIRKTEEMLDVEIRLHKASNRLGLGMGLAEQERQDIEAALEKQGLARRFDLEKTGRDIESQRMVLENSIRVLDQKLKAEIDQQQVELDGKIRARVANLEMDLKRIREIEGAKIESEADTIRRKSQIDLDAVERDKRLESMKTLMEIRKDRDKSTAGLDLEKMKLFKEMTPEQIMLVNPNVTREAAAAMAAKFSEKNMKEVADHATDQAKRMQAFLEKMAEEQREIVYAANGIRGPGPKRRKEDRDSSKEKSSKDKTKSNSEEEDEE
jgi:hypothetical protein